MGMGKKVGKGKASDKPAASEEQQPFVEQLLYLACPQCETEVVEETGFACGNCEWVAAPKPPAKKKKAPPPRKEGEDPVERVRKESADEVAARRREWRRTAAQAKLKGELSKNYGVESVAGLAELDPANAEILRTERSVRNMLVEACAVPEVELLLGMKSAEVATANAALLAAILEDNVAEVRKVIDAGTVDLLQRDARGNLPIHYAKSMAVFSLLKLREEDSDGIKNGEGMTAAALLYRGLADEEMAAELCKNEGELRALLYLDPCGVSEAMQAQGRKREMIEETVSSWEDVAKLLKDVDGLPGSLLALKPEGLWREVLALHLFGEAEIWRCGNLTPQANERLGTLWLCVQQLLRRVYDRSDEQVSDAALRAAGLLLHASKGPREVADTRAPYRERLSEEMMRLEVQSEVLLKTLHSKMRGEAAEWLRSFPEPEGYDKVDPFAILVPDDELQHLQISNRLRRLHSRKDRKPVLEVPEWVHGKEVDLEAVFRDLKQVGEVQDNSEAGYTLLSLRHGFQAEAFPARLLPYSEPTTMYWFAMWLRGVCQQHQHLVATEVSRLLSGLKKPVVVADGDNHLDANLFCRTEAKGLPRMCAKILEEVQQLGEQFLPKVEVLPGEDGEPAAPPPEEMEAFKSVLAKAATLILDMNGVTFLAEDADELQQAVELMRKSNGVLRVKNGYHTKAQAFAGYCDMKVFLAIPSEKYGQEVVEVILMLKDAFAEKHWQHTPYEYFRGDMDKAKPGKPSAEFEAQVRAEASRKVEEEAAARLRAAAILSLRSLWIFPRAEDMESMVSSLQGLWASRSDQSETYTVSGLAMVRARGAEARTLDLKWNAAEGRLEFAAGRYYLVPPAVTPCFTILWRSADEDPEEKQGKGFAWRRLRSRRATGDAGGPEPGKQASKRGPPPFAELGPYHDGTLDSGELVELLRAGRPDAEDADVQGLLGVAVPEGNGRIDFAGVLDLVRELKPVL